MSVLPTVRRQVVQAAAELARAEPNARMDRGSAVREHGLWYLVAALSVVVVAVVIAALALVRHDRPIPTGSVAFGGPGLAAPVLRLGEALYVVAIEQTTTPWRPASAVNGSGVAPGTVVDASTRAAVVDRVEFRQWLLRSGDGREVSRRLGEPRFVGRARDRAEWKADGARSQFAVASSATTASLGFEVGNRTFTYGELLHFPTDRGSVMRLFPAPPVLPAANQMNEIGSVLEDVPLPPRARAALFDALAELGGVQHLGHVRDPLGRAGIAFATTAPMERPVRLFPGATGGAPLPLRTELIFDPRTKALLASETILMRSSAVRGLGRGYAISWTAFVSSKVVRASVVPPVTPPPCPPGAVEIAAPGERGPSQTGEHAYFFTVTNVSSTPCTLDGYPSLALSRGTRAIPFLYHHGGGPYVTSRPPRPVTIRPRGRAYFLVAKYRCDGRNASTPTAMNVAHLGLGGVARLDLASAAITDLNYCRRYAGDVRVDPGNIVTVSPFEPTRDAAVLPPP